MKVKKEDLEKWCENTIPKEDDIDVHADLWKGLPDVIELEGEPVMEEEKT